MIRNDRQLKTTLARLDEVRRAAADALPGDRVVFDDLADELDEQIRQYQGVRSGQVIDFAIASIDELADALIKARIARGLTQSELAKSLDVSEQMVQRDEAGGYERAGLARIAEVADVLGYQLTGVLSPNESVQLLEAGNLSAVWRPRVWCTGPEHGRQHAETSSMTGMLVSMGTAS